MEIGLRLVLGCLVVAAAGCYRPSIEPCKLACSTAGICPGDLQCNAAGLCAASASDVCGGDSGIADARPDSACGWPVISNLDPCMLDVDAVTTTWTVTSSWTIDTTALTARRFDGEPLPVIEVAQTEATPSLPMVALIKVKTLDVQATGTISVNGVRPLVILVGDTATIHGKIRVTPGSLECPAPGGDAALSTVGTGGGGGGGLGLNDHGTAGAAGGAGGAVAGVAGSPGLKGAAASDAAALALSPLRPGCPGGRGGGFDATQPQNRGPGGGAIQISARTRISIVSPGAIEAGGGGGGPGPDDGSGSSHLGGGGGGSGGAILLEAPVVNLDAAQLCANGGGGGGSSHNYYDGGAPGACSTTGAFGGGTYGGRVEGAGGNGATGLADATAGSAGIAGTFTGGGSGSGQTNAGGGGGGGGGVGRIRINGMVVATPSTFSTPAYLNN